MPTVTGQCDQCGRDIYGKARTCRFCQQEIDTRGETVEQPPIAEARTATTTEAEVPQQGEGQVDQVMPSDSAQGEPEEVIEADQAPPTSVEPIALSTEAQALIDLFAEFDNQTSIRQLRLGLSWTFPKTIRTLKANPHLFRQIGKTKWEYFGG